MFQFPGFPWYTYVFSIPFTILHREGFPIRISTDIMLIYNSPWLFAVNRVLHRLLMPRHSPYALCNLNLLFSFAWYSQYLFTDLVACYFYHPLVAKLQFFLPFSWKDQFINFYCFLNICSFALFGFQWSFASPTFTSVGAMFCAFACEMKS